MPRVLDNKTPAPMTDHRLRVAAHMREVKLLEEIVRSIMENPRHCADHNRCMERNEKVLESVEGDLTEIRQSILQVQGSIDALYMIVLEDQTEDMEPGRWYERLFRKIRKPD